MASIANLWKSWRSTRGAQRELIVLGICLLIGMLLLPVAIWLVGDRLLGDYAHGGVGSLLADYYRGLAGGSLAFWIVAAGPYAAVWCVRLLRRGLRR